MSIASYIIAGVLVSNPASLEVSLNDYICLTEAIYNEARGEDLAGRRAVANVIINRVKSKRWPDTICSVVYQDSQFEYREDKIGTIIEVNNFLEEKALAEIAQISYNAVNGVLKDNTYGSNHYYAHNKIVPYWAKTEDGLVIGNHTFLNI